MAQGLASGSSGCGRKPEPRVCRFEPCVFNRLGTKLPFGTSKFISIAGRSNFPGEGRPFRSQAPVSPSAHILWRSPQVTARLAVNSNGCGAWPTARAAASRFQITRMQVSDQALSAKYEIVISRYLQRNQAFELGAVSVPRVRTAVHATARIRGAKQTNVREAQRTVGYAVCWCRHRSEGRL